MVRAVFDTHEQRFAELFGVRGNYETSESVAKQIDPVQMHLWSLSGFEG